MNHLVGLRLIDIGPGEIVAPRAAARKAALVMEQVTVLGGPWSGIERRGTALAEGKPFVDAPIHVRLSPSMADNLPRAALYDRSQAVRS